MKKFLISLAVCFGVFILAWAIFFTCLYFNDLDSQNGQLNNSIENVEYIEDGNNQYLLKQLNSLIEQKQILSVELNETKLNLEVEQNKNTQNQQKISEQEQKISDLENQIIGLNNEITRLNTLFESYEELREGTYAVSFYDGNILLRTIAIPKNSAIYTTPTFEEDDTRVFRGWALSNDSEEIIEDITQLEITEDISFYARFYYWYADVRNSAMSVSGTEVERDTYIFSECKDIKVVVTDFRILFNYYNDPVNGVYNYEILHYTTNGWEGTNYYSDYDYEPPFSDYENIIVNNNKNTIILGNGFSVFFELNSNIGTTQSHVILSISVEDDRYLEGVSNYTLFNTFDYIVYYLK